MSCLSRKFSLKEQKLFKNIYNTTTKWHSRHFVVFYKKATNLKVAFVASKKVSKSAVKRNKAKRVLKALCLKKDLKNGYFIFVAKSDILNIDFFSLQKEFNFALKRLL